MTSYFALASHPVGQKLKLLFFFNYILNFNFCSQVVNAVMSLVLIQAVKKEEEEATIYKN